MNRFHRLFHAFFNFNIGVFVNFLYGFLYGDNYISATCWFITRRSTIRMSRTEHCRGLAIRRCCFNQWLGRLIEKWKHSSYKILDKVLSPCFLKNKVVLSMIIFSSKNSKTPYSGHLVLAYTFFWNRRGPL